MSTRLLFACLLACALVACTTEEEGPGPLQAGAARVFLPAPLGIGTTGDAPFGLPSTGSPYSEIFPGTHTIHGAPGAKVVVLSRGAGHEVVFMRLDSIAVPQQVRDGVVAEVLARTGRDLDDALIIGATHSHSTPGRFIDNRILQTIVDLFEPNWYRRLIGALSDAVIDAYDALEGAEVAYAMASTTEAHQDRRCEDGEDYTDGTLPVLSVTRGGTPYAVVLAYATHATALGSADYTLSAQQHGAVEEKIEGAFDVPVTALHLSSWGGDMSSAAPDVPGTGLTPVPSAYDRFERIAVHLSDLVVGVMNDLETSDDVDVHASTTRYPINLAELDYELGEFPYPNGGVYCNSDPECDLGPARQDDLTDGCTAFPDESPAPMVTMHTVGRIGDLALMTWPGESGTRLAQGSVERMRSATGLEDVLFVGYGNDYLGYQLEEDDWWLGGYESSGGMWGPRQGEYMRSRLDEIAAVDVALQAGEERAFSFVEPGPAPLFDSNGGDEPTVPEEALEVGVVVAEPEPMVPRDGVATFTVNGSEPWVGTPVAVLQRRVGDVFRDVSRAAGAPVDSNSYAFDVHLAPAPSYLDADAPAAREFRWTFSFFVTRRAPGFELPSGDYRFRVTIPQGPEVTSAAFVLP